MRLANGFTNCIPGLAHGALVVAEQLHHVRPARRDHDDTAQYEAGDDDQDGGYHDQHRLERPRVRRGLPEQDAA